MDPMIMVFLGVVLAPILAMYPPSSNSPGSRLKDISRFKVQSFQSKKKE